MVSEIVSVAAERRKELGAFYTPPELVSALTSWALRSSQDRVLEPAAGEAAFLIEAIRRLRALGSSAPAEQVVGVEIDRRAWANANRVLEQAGESCSILRSDFFKLKPDDLGGEFDAAVGNPPYIRYQRFKGAARERGLRAAASNGVTLTGLASSWAHFVVHAAHFVRPEGRLAFVLPAELLHVDYAGPVRDFLVKRFGSVTILTFDEGVFPGASIDTVLLLAEGGSTKGVRVLRLKNVSEVGDLLDAPFVSSPVTRWSSLRIPGDGGAVLTRLRKEGRLARLGDFAEVDIGCVTGANSFFILSSEEVKRRGLPPSALQPLIARAAQLPGALLTRADGRALLEAEDVFLLRLKSQALDREDSALGRYLRRGRRLGIHLRYKCRVRSPWYSVPGVRIPDAFMSYMSHRAPRIALNEAGFGSTNLVHHVNFHLTSRPIAAAVIAALHSSVALLSFEIEGRSYGGGVLKHETKEAERVELPALEGRLATRLGNALPEIDSALRGGGPDAAATVADIVLVSEGVLTTDDLASLMSSREELRDRRATRGRTST